MRNDCLPMVLGGNVVFCCLFPVGFGDGDGGGKPLGPPP